MLRTIGAVLAPELGAVLASIVSTVLLCVRGIGRSEALLTTAAVTTKRESKRLLESTRCEGIEVDITISKDHFQPSALARVIPYDGEVDLTKGAVSGPLRFGGRGHDDYRIVGRSDFHGFGDDPHYHFLVRASKASKPFAANRDIPTVFEFFAAIEKGILKHDDPGNVVFVVGRHAYPSSWWRRKVVLPAPFSEPDAAGDKADALPVAQLTGVEVTYENGDRILVSRIDDETFSTVTSLLLPRVVPDLFRVAIERSAQLGSRFFRRP
ncbi:MAG: hypothetical protein ACJ8GN_15555 [Longimicrobiaceae bacterium]